MHPVPVAFLPICMQFCKHLRSFTARSKSLKGAPGSSVLARSKCAWPVWLIFHVCFDLVCLRRWKHYSLFIGRLIHFLDFPQFCVKEWLLLSVVIHYWAGAVWSHALLRLCVVDWILFFIFCLCVPLVWWHFSTSAASFIMSIAERDQRGGNKGD